MLLDRVIERDNQRSPEQKPGTCVINLYGLVTIVGIRKEAYFLVKTILFLFVSRGCFIDYISGDGRSVVTFVVGHEVVGSSPAFTKFFL